MSATAETDRHVAPFSWLTIALLIGVGITAFGAFLVLSAYPPEGRDDSRGGNNALSNSAIGFAGLIGLLHAQEAPVTIARMVRPGPPGSTLVLTPPPAEGSGAFWPLVGSATQVLIVLPKWATMPDRGHAGWVDKAGLIDPAAATTMLPAPAALSRRPGRPAAILHGGSGRFSGVQGLQLAAIDHLQTIGISADWTPLLLDETGEVLLARWTHSTRADILVLTDPDLLDTQGLKDAAGAQAAMTILKAVRGDAPLIFDVTLDGLAVSRNLLQLLFEPPLLGATLCAAAAALMILAMALHRFGPALRAPRVLDFGKRALVDNSADLIALARREARMAMPYAQLMRTLATQGAGALRRSSGPSSDDELDRASASRGLADTYTGLATAAEGAGDRTALLAIARRLHQWSQGMGRAHR